MRWREWHLLQVGNSRRCRANEKSEVPPRLRAHAGAHSSIVRALGRNRPCCDWGRGIWVLGHVDCTPLLGLYCILLVKHAYKRFPRRFLKTWGNALPWSARGSHKLVQTDYFKSFPAGFARGPLPDADVRFHAYGLGQRDRSTLTYVFNIETQTLTKPSEDFAGGRC